MGVPGSGFVISAVLTVFGIVLLVGLVLAVLFVVLSRHKRDKQAQSGQHNFDYVSTTPPPEPPADEPQHH